MSERSSPPAREPILCRLGWHAPQKGALWNEGYYFTRCDRCGSELIRTTYSGWEVPRGFRIVWKPRPVEPGAAPAAPEPAQMADAARVAEAEPVAAAPEPSPAPSADAAPTILDAPSPIPTPEVEPEPERPAEPPAPTTDELIERALTALNRGSARPSMFSRDVLPVAPEPEAENESMASPPPFTDTAPPPRHMPWERPVPAPEPAPEGASSAPAAQMPRAAALETDESPPSPIETARPESLVPAANGDHSPVREKLQPPAARPTPRIRSSIPDFMDEPEEPSPAPQPPEPARPAPLAQPAAHPAGGSTAGS